ncbi:MAG: TatD family hydrolase [Candidatus Yanofskybacteria bacterium]|nr:TatD family hydrolase [Candidatus Yanofskybacteria bacterium]
MSFDSHCHPQMAQYDKDREEVIARAQRAGVSMICVGTDLEISRQAIELARKHERIWATVGLHPNEVSDATDRLMKLSYDEIVSMPKVVAVGEVGLDYYRTPELEKQKKQKETFAEFIDLARRIKKPMILHFRDSPKGSSGRVHKDALEILPKDIVGVSHSFTGNIKDAKNYLDRGIYLGFNGIITFARQYDEVIRYVPLEQILLETDAPFLTPEPHRGKRNEPAYVIEVAKKLAELKNESLEKIIEQTTENCKNLFNIVD